MHYDEDGVAVDDVVDVIADAIKSEHGGKTNESKQPLLLPRTRVDNGSGLTTPVPIDCTIARTQAVKRDLKKDKKNVENPEIESGTLCMLSTRSAN
jgi:hypothetical protein